MKNILLTFFGTLLISIPAFSQNSRDAASIPDSLKQHANAVIREYTVTYNRTSVGSYSREVHEVTTILNSNGLKFASLAVFYDRNSEVDGISGEVYDAHGNLLKKVRNKDIQDYAYNDSYTLFADSRVKLFRPAYKIYPFTVEYNYTVNHSELVSFSNWRPFSGYNISVEKAQMNFITPAQFNLRHKELNGDLGFTKKIDKNTIEYHWEISDAKAFKKESMAPDAMDIFPTVLLSPDKISYEGTTGNFSSWKSYGEWTYQLIQDRMLLPEETVLKLMRLTDSIPDERGKVKAIYQYMQAKTRYVNITLGIGGFQPLKAEDVDEKGYGDCKALSNYTRSLLHAIGIEAYYTEIGSGDDNNIKFPDFPGVSQTNHIVLCVPLKQDTVWLECTNQHYPFNYLGSSNSDRYALQITKEGGKLVRTPSYPDSANIRTSRIKVRLRNNGSAAFHMESEFRDAEYENVLGLVYLSGKEQKDLLMQGLDITGLEIHQFSITDDSRNTPKATLSVEGETNRYAMPSGNRLFVGINFLLGNEFPEKLRTDRKYSIYQPDGFTYRDTLSIDIPAGYRVEYLPKQSPVASPYGTYHLNFQQSGDTTIEVTRQVVIHKGTFEATDAKVINEFLTSVAAEERKKVVLVKKS